MATPQTAVISLDEIIMEWLVKRMKTMHSYWKICPIACEAVQELQLTSLPLLNHVELTKESDVSWFELPDGFVEYVNVGIRFAERWTPVGVTDRLIPVPMTSGEGEFDDEYTGGEFDRDGEWERWNHEGLIPYNNLGMFNYSRLQVDTNNRIASGRFTNVPRCDEVAFNVEKGIIMVPNNFPSNKLYLSYMGIGQIDTMTNIPINAQAAIEAYISWKYLENSRSAGNQDKERARLLWVKQHNLLRSRLNKLTSTDIRRIVDRGYMIGVLSFGDGAYGWGTPCAPPAHQIRETTVIGVAGVTITSPVIGGLGVAFIIIDGQFKNTGYTVSGNTITLTDGTILIGGEAITIYFT